MQIPRWICASPKENGPARGRPVIQFEEDLRLEPAAAAAGIASTSTPGTTTAAAPHPAATGPRRASLAVAVTAIHRTVRHRLERQLVNRLAAVRALEVEMPYVDHPSLSETHSISFCSLGPPSTDCRRRSLRGDTVPQFYAKGKRDRARSRLTPRTTIHSRRPGGAHPRPRAGARAGSLSDTRGRGSRESPPHRESRGRSGPWPPRRASTGSA